MIEAFQGSTSHSLFFSLVDPSTGLGKAGIAAGSVAANYARSRSARVAVPVSALAAATDAFSAGGWFEVDGANQPGLYRLDAPDAAFAAGAEEVVVTVKAVGAKTEHRGFRLVAWNKDVAAIPNATAGAAGGLPTADVTGAVKVQSGTGAGQINLASGNVTLTDGSVTAAKFATAAITGSALATDAISGPAVSSTAASKIAAAAWDMPRPGHQGTGSFGELLDAAVSSRLGSAAAPANFANLAISTNGVVKAIPSNSDGTPMPASSAVQIDFTQALPASPAAGTVGEALRRADDNLDAVVSSRLAAAAYAAPPSAAAIAAQVWQADVSAGYGGGQAGAKLNAAGATVDPWATAVPGAYGPGTAGYLVGSRLDAPITAVKVKTDNLPAQPAAVGSAMTLAPGEHAGIQSDATAALNANATLTQLASTLQFAPGGGPQFTATALALAPIGGGPDWTAAERAQIRYRLGLDGAASTPSAAPSLGTVSATIAAGGIASTSFAAGAVNASAFSQAAADKVWSSTARTLSAFGFGVSVATGGITSSSFDAGILPTNFANLVIAPGGAVTAGTVSDKAGYKLAPDGTDAVMIEPGANLRQATSAIFAASAGVLTGAASSTITIKGGGVSTTRMVATVDADGNRDAVTLSLPS